ncbi:MAG: hypothetical protein HY922_06810 [Elusimicrobia bacterium]|nr:hypothetical protein [Elusimicrobiota bacterium]
MNPRGKSPSAQRFGALLQAVRIRRLRPRDVSARKAGIEVRADAWVLGAQDEQVNSDLEKNSRYSVVILGPDVLGAKQGAVVPIVGHALSHVQDHRSGAHGRSRAATETKAYLTQIYVSQELEKAGLDAPFRGAPA